MLVVIETVSGGAGRVQLRSDQVLKVGRSGWADLSIPSDAELLDMHFEVGCSAEGCFVRALSHEAPTLLNGEPVATSPAYDGDEVRAGGCVFRLMVQGGPVRAEEEPEPEPEPETKSEKPEADTVSFLTAGAGLAGVCAYLEFGDDVKPLAEKHTDQEDLIQEMAKQEMFQDAIKLRAYTLPKREAIWWGCLCLRNDLSDPLPDEQTEALVAAEEWVEKNDETRRRHAESKAAAAQYSGPGATLALGAFWSDGSLAPEGSPKVEPDERLTSQGITATLVAAAYHGDPKLANDRFLAFLARGKEVADGKVPLPGEA